MRHCFAHGDDGVGALVRWRTHPYSCQGCAMPCEKGFGRFSRPPAACLGVSYWVCTLYGCLVVMEDGGAADHCRHQAGHGIPQDPHIP